ncbi:hypothetical protein ANO14919_052800 [Xylariales sp. No.14919]|nr:hypothetical protein ANO14919_052800 [Xylariales sp. No.14919]
MKLSYLLSFFLASLVITSPVATPNETDDVALTTRTTTNDTPEYKAAIAAEPTLLKDKYYYFTIKWPLGAAVGDGDQESDEELKALQRQLGFEHIGVVVGQITERVSGKGKNEKITRDFNAFLYHMTKKNKNPGDTEFKHSNYRADAKPLIFGGETSNKKANSVSKAGKEYVSVNKFYKVQGNNCKNFADAVIEVLR